MKHKLFIQPMQSGKTTSAINYLTEHESAILYVNDKVLPRREIDFKRTVRNWSMIQDYIKSRSNIILIIDEYLRLTVEQRKFIQENKQKFDTIIAYGTPTVSYNLKDFNAIRKLKTRPHNNLDLQIISDTMEDFDSLYFNLLTDHDVEIIHTPKYHLNNEGHIPTDKFNMDFNALFLK